MHGVFTVRRAERRYSREKQARVTASLATTAPEKAPEDLTAALEAGVESVDGHASEHTTGPVPTAPSSEALMGASFDADATRGAPFGDDEPQGGSGSPILAPPMDPESHGILQPPGLMPPRF